MSIMTMATKSYKQIWPTSSKCGQWLILLIFVPAFLFATSQVVRGDTVYLKDNPQGNAGQVLEEYPDAIVIKFPKTEIKRIEASEKPPFTEANPSSIVWVEGDNSITLRLPKRLVTVTGAEGLAAGDTVTTVIDLPANTPAKTAELQQPTEVSTTGQTIQGKVLWKGEPLSACQVRIRRVPDSGRLFSLRAFKKMGKDDTGVYETVTDEHGIYTFTRVPYGEYDIYWKPEEQSQWVRKLSEFPDIILAPSSPVFYRDIEAYVQTIN